MPKHKLVIIAVVAGVSLYGWSALRNGDTPPAADPAAPAPGSAGFIATTGDPADPDATKGLADEATGTSGEGLVEEASPVPGGGTMVDLQGRFRNMATVTVADSDSVVVECLPDTAKGGAE